MHQAPFGFHLLKLNNLCHPRYPSPQAHDKRAESESPQTFTKSRFGIPEPSLKAEICRKTKTPNTRKRLNRPPVLDDVTVWTVRRPFERGLELGNELGDHYENREVLFLCLGIVHLGLDSIKTLRSLGNFSFRAASSRTGAVSKRYFGAKQSSTRNGRSATAEK